MANNPPETIGEALLNKGCGTLDESTYATAYLKEYNPLILGEFIRTHDRMSQKMRDFIANVLEGNIKRPKGRKSLTINRDAEIWEQAQVLKRQGKRLRGNAKEDGIDCILGHADKFDLEGEVIIKAIQRIDKHFLKNISIETRGGRVVFSPKFVAEIKAKIESEVMEKDS